MKCTVCRRNKGEPCVVTINGKDIDHKLCDECQKGLRDKGAKVVADSAYDTCLTCGKDLAKQDTCFADGLNLYCAASCIEKDNIQYAEEISTADIGIRKVDPVKCDLCKNTNDTLQDTKEHGSICPECNNKLRKQGEIITYAIN